MQYVIGLCQNEVNYESVYGSLLSSFDTKATFSVVRFYYYQPSHAIGLVLLFFIFKKTMKPPMQLEMKGM